MTRHKQKSKGLSTTDESILKVLFFAMGSIARKWTTPIADLKRALNQVVHLLGDRVPTV